MDDESKNANAIEIERFAEEADRRIKDVFRELVKAHSNSDQEQANLKHAVHSVLATHLGLLERMCLTTYQAGQPPEVQNQIELKLIAERERYFRQGYQHAVEHEKHVALRIGTPHHRQRMDGVRGRVRKLRH